MESSSLWQAKCSYLMSMSTDAEFPKPLTNRISNDTKWPVIIKRHIKLGTWARYGIAQYFIGGIYISKKNNNLIFKLHMHPQQALEGRSQQLMLDR